MLATVLWNYVPGDKNRAWIPWGVERRVWGVLNVALDWRGYREETFLWCAARRWQGIRDWPYEWRYILN